MGRPKAELTPEQIAERKQRWWGEERNARRRARYHEDAEYREKTIKAVKTRYRVVRQEQGVEVRDDDASENLAELRMIGQEREVRLREDRIVQELTFTVEEIAKAVDRNPQVIYRWLQNGMLPKAVYEGRNMRNRWHTLYTVHEARAIMMVFSAHQCRSQYYREVHTDTRDRMFEAVRAARANFISQE